MTYLLHIETEGIDAVLESAKKHDKDLQVILETILRFDGYFSVSENRLVPTTYEPGSDVMRVHLDMGEFSNLHGVLRGSASPHIHYLDGSMRYVRKAGDALEFWDPADELDEFIARYGPQKESI